MSIEIYYCRSNFVFTCTFTDNHILNIEKRTLFVKKILIQFYVGKTLEPGNHVLERGLPEDRRTCTLNVVPVNVYHLIVFRQRTCR